MKHTHAFLIVLISLVLVGCSSQQKSAPQEQPSTIEVPSEQAVTEAVTTTETTQSEVESTQAEEIVPVVDYLALRPYEIGNIMVVMYHGIEEGSPPYQRTETEFIKDLQYMYDHNYRLISMSDYKNSNVNIPAGMTPIVLTFDDGKSSTFSLEDVNGQLTPKEGTAIALLEKFAQEHPDFGKEASLFINGDNEAFNGAGTLQQRLQWLIDHGYEVGNHTYDHADLSKLSGDQVQAEIGRVDSIIKKAIPGYTVDVITYPFGIRPAEQFRNFVIEGAFENKTYHYALGFREGVSGPMVAPLHIGFNAYNCPRVRGSEGEESDLWWWFSYYEEHPDYLYKSDGNVNRVALPKENEDKVNKELLGQKELYLY